MKLIFLGSGSAFTMDNYQSNMILETETTEVESLSLSHKGVDVDVDLATTRKRLLIDCGSDIRWSLAEQGLSYKDIQNIYISHLHPDHFSGLE